MIEEYVLSITILTRRNVMKMFLLMYGKKFLNIRNEEDFDLHTHMKDATMVDSPKFFKSIIDYIELCKQLYNNIPVPTFAEYAEEPKIIEVTKTSINIPDRFYKFELNTKVKHKNRDDLYTVVERLRHGTIPDNRYRLKVINKESYSMVYEDDLIEIKE